MRIPSIVRFFVLAAFVISLAAPARAEGDGADASSQAPAAQPTPAPKAAEPPLRRWVEFQQLTFYSRYRYIDNSLGVKTADHLQWKDSIRGRFNLDPQKRYTINVGVFSGSNFTSTWDNYGVGTGGPANHYEYFKQLYGSAAPIKGLELQYGGIYVIRGENDEWTTYDDDGYLMGERVSLRRPQEAYFDEISVTRAMIGPYETPSIADRWDGLAHPNYWQFLVDKKFSRAVAGSLDYTDQSGDHTLRAATTIRLAAKAPVQTIRYEQYVRMNRNAAAGFGLWAERPITKYLRLQGGYVTVDEYYGPTDTKTRSREWNADRMQRGKRFFAMATIPIYGPLSASIYATHALDVPYTVTIHNRVDVVVQYDVLDTLRRTGVF